MTQLGVTPANEEIAVVPSGFGPVQWYGNQPPQGWLMCNGQRVLRTQFPDLDNVIGQTYGSYSNSVGGAGTTHMQLPDMRGRTLVGTGSESTGFTGGGEKHTLSLNEMPQHTHTMSSGTHSHGVSDPGHIHERYTYTAIHEVAGVGMNYNPGAINFLDRAIINMPSQYYNPTGSNGSSITIDPVTITAEIQNSGSSTPHNNMQPYLVTNFIIKA